MPVHFTREELQRSRIAQERGLDNRCPDEFLPNLDQTAAGLERVRAFLGGLPIEVLSGYRSPAVNAAAHGSPRSQHLVGQAADIRCPKFGDPRTVAAALASKLDVLGIDQLILEATWVHVSFTLTPRSQTLTCVSPGEYVEGLA